MAMTIGVNSHSMTAARSLHESAKTMAEAMERLSTGKRINSASDDAAGLAITESMTAQAKSLEMAAKNIANGTALASTIEAALDEVSDMLTRMRELAVQAASETYSANDRIILNDEMVALRNEIDALTTRVTFGDQKLLDGTFNGKVIQVGDDANETITVNQASVASSAIGAFTMVGEADDAQVNTSGAFINAFRTAGHDFEITPSGGTATTSNYGTAQATSAKEAADAVNLETGTHGVTATATTVGRLQLVLSGDNNLALSIGTTFSNLVSLDTATSRDTLVAAINKVSAQTGITANAGAGANDVTVTDIDGHDIIVQNRNDGTGTATSDVKLAQFVTGSATGEVTVQDDQGNDFGMLKGRITLTSDKQFATTEGGSTAFLATNATANSSLVSSASLTSVANATSAISVFDGAIDRVASMKAGLGATTNRLNHALDSTIVLRDKIEEAVATLSDADYSAESAKLARAQVQQQVGTAMLAQANAQPQLVLQLIQ